MASDEFFLGQVGALFIVGLGEYAVVWLRTDWDLEVERGRQRNEEEAKRKASTQIS
jgi:multidrug resistance protein, MATE family